MHETTRKIATACSVSAVSFCIVALIFAPAYWGLGFIAGAAAGYLGFEFRETLKAIPKAFAGAVAAIREASSDFCEFFSPAVADLVNYILRPHPFLLFSTFPTIAFWVCMFRAGKWDGTVDVSITSVLGFMIVWGLVGGVATVFLMFAPMTFGVQMEGSYGWKRDPTPIVDARPLLTYRSAFRWMFRGWYEFFAFFCWRIWQHAIFAIWCAIYYGGMFAGVFLWQLFKLIHSEKRLLCAVDGTLGGYVSYHYLAPSAHTLGAQIVLILFGGFLGAAFGVINWELVSKRWLKVPAAISAQ